MPFKKTLKMYYLFGQPKTGFVFLAEVPSTGIEKNILTMVDNSSKNNKVY
jgi:hypothetical protein